MGAADAGRDRAVPENAAQSSRVVVVVNKYWECDPVMGVLFNMHASPLTPRQWPHSPVWPHVRENPPLASIPPNPNPSPRAVLLLDHVSAEIWCISDLLDHLPDDPMYQSSTAQKAARLPLIIGARPPDLVIAVGTAAFPDSGQNNNGAVVIGTQVFMRDGHPGNTHSMWNGPFGVVLPSTLTEQEFLAMTSIAGDVHHRLLPTPHTPWGQRGVIATFRAVAISNSNVTAPAEYKQTDALALSAYMARDANNQRVFRDPAGSLETTHGVIRATVGDRFLFVSGIIDRIGYFEDDVGFGAGEYAQNVVGAHNAGVAVAWMLRAIDAVEGARLGQDQGR